MNNISQALAAFWCALQPARGTADLELGVHEARRSSGGAVHLQRCGAAQVVHQQRHSVACVHVAWRARFGSRVALPGLLIRSHVRRAAQTGKLWQLD